MSSLSLDITGDDESVTVVATLLDDAASPLSGKTIYFFVSGANIANGSDVTDGSGEAAFFYAPSSAGADTIRAQLGTATLDLVSVDTSTDRASRHDGFSATELDFFATPGSLQPVDISHDGENLLIATSDGALSGEVYRMVGFSSSVDASLSGLNGLNALTMHNGDLYTAYLNGDVKRHDGFSSTILSTINVGTTPTAPRGLGFKEDDLLTAVLAGAIPESYVRRYTGFSTVVAETLTMPYSATSNITGLVWDGDNLITCSDIVSGAGDDKIHRHVGFSATVAETIDSPSPQVRGVGWTAALFTYEDFVVAPVVEEGWGVLI